MRLFFGLPVKDELGFHLSKMAQPPLQSSAETLQWVKKGNFHITLRFIGHVALTDIPALCEAAATHMTKFSAMQLILSKIDHFPPKHYKVVAAYVESNAQLEHLYNTIEHSVITLGYKSEGRAYVPHVTLAKNKKIHRQCLFSPIMLTSCVIQVDRLVLYSSESGDHGVVYRPIATWSLV